jgi:hypothetical protein
LQHETSFAKVLGMLAFPEFVGGKPIAVGGEGLDNGFERVRRIEPLLRV